MNVTFLRGLYKNYNATTHEDGIYFATDKKTILVNGIEYGLNADQAAILENAVLSVSYTSPNVIKITHKNGTVDTITLTVASATTDGLMPKEKFSQVDDNTDRIEALEIASIKNKITAADKSLIITESDNNTTAKVNIKTGQAVVLDATDGVGLSIAADDKVLTQSASGLVANVSIAKVTTGLSANVLEQYNIIGKNNTVLGSIPIYKDSTLKSVVRDGQSLVYTYILADGTEKVVNIDMSDFILESEYADGLQVIDGVISVKKDTTSESFLTVSEDGIKISGIQNAIDTVINGLNVATIGNANTIVTSVTEANGKISATTIAKNATNISSTAVAASDTAVSIAGTNLQTNINNIAIAIKTEETARTTGDANTLASAKSYTDTCLTWEVLS